MPDEASSETPARRGWALPAMGWASAVLAVYVLSPGPVIALWKDPPVGISDFYLPLEKLYQAVPFVHAFYDWYFTFWGIK